MPHQDRAFEPESIDHIEGMKGDVRHVADMNAADYVPDAQCLDQLFHALAHGFGTAGNDVAEFNQLLPGQARPLAEVWSGQLPQELRLDRLYRAVPRRLDKAWEDVQ